MDACSDVLSQQHGEGEVGGASGCRQTGLADALCPGVEEFRHRVLVGQLQQFGRHVLVDSLQEAVGT